MHGPFVELSQYLLFGLIILAIFALQYKGNKDNQHNIRQYLKKKKVADVEIEKVWFDRDRDTSTYEVRYTDQEGKRHHTTCKIRNSLFYPDHRIYWEHPP